MLLPIQKALCHHKGQYLCRQFLRFYPEMMLADDSRNYNHNYYSLDLIQIADFGFVYCQYLNCQLVVMCRYYLNLSNS